MEFKCKKDECDGDCSSYLISIVNEVLENGECIVYPTETLYGLGGDPFREGMIDKIRRIKESPSDKKISIAYSDLDHASEFLELPELAWELGEEFLPGPLTVVIETPEGTEGIRVPDHPLAQSVIDNFGPITSTSANIHGRPAPREVKTAEIQLDGKVKLYVNCGRCELGQGSTVVKVGEELDILREGVISEKEIGDKIGL
ncbi:MAG: threonylcarbamoyl-AMP synthase [Candidatus Thermoplasmatota archaeon]|nr:threonylcarbamoyl-AMP synthase [Candidatus Thermoplasmatota archaeon]